MGFPLGVRIQVGPSPDLGVPSESLHLVTRGEDFPNGICPNHEVRLGNQGSMAPRYETVSITIDDAAIAEGNLWRIIEPVWWLGDIYNGEASYEGSLRPFSTEQRLIFALRWYRSEVNNGGHHQFYSNSTGVVWKDALRAFVAIGLQAGADIILESANRLGGQPSLDHETRLEQLEEYDPAFRDLDERFYELGRETDLVEAMMAFVRANPAAFHFEGEVRILVFS